MPRSNPDQWWPSDIGPSWPTLGWVPTPRYLLRRDRVLGQIARIPTGRLLEVGCGAGALLQEFSALGFNCDGLETSAQAIALARAISHSSKLPVQLHEVPNPQWNCSFSVVVALEVLEHIENDIAALRNWADWLQPAGRIVLSVPAHTHRWGAADEWAGHVRRYDRPHIEQALIASGFKVEAIECYGFPLGNALDLLSSGGYARAVIRHADGTPNRMANNDRSGVDRSAAMQPFRLLSSWPGRLLIRCAYALQAMFVGTERGTGYVIMASKV